MTNSISTQSEFISSLAVVAEVFADGQKITAAAVEFDRDIDNEKLSQGSFLVQGRTIVNIYSNTEPARTTQPKNGRHVVLELSLEDKEAIVLPKPSAAPRHMADSLDGPPSPGFFPKIPLRIRKHLKLGAKQLGDIVAVDGTILPPCGEEMVSSKVFQPIVDEFQQHQYKNVSYSIFIPAKYDTNTKYPLVMFIADASANGSDPYVSLTQGIGGVIWADPAEQAKHPCFVLIPQIPYDVRLTKDDFTVSPELETIKELLDDVACRYSIDMDRIYATGQSQGCMASCELNVRYPDFFAGSLLVSGQWNPETMASKLTKKRLFIALSEGGPKEFPGMNAVVAALEAAGAKTARVSLDARKSKEQLDADVNELIASGADILYAVYDAKTVLPDNRKEYPQIAHHSRGWEITYDIEAIRDWLFSQVKST